jgi:hypothetical protein
MPSTPGPVKGTRAFVGEVALIYALANDSKHMLSLSSAARAAPAARMPRISRDEPRVARVDFLLANGESLVVEVPRYVLERLLVRAKRAIEAAPLLARGPSIGHSAHSRNNNSWLSSRPNSTADQPSSGVAYPKMLHINPVWHRRERRFVIRTLLVGSALHASRIEQLTLTVASVLLLVLRPFGRAARNHQHF